LSAQPVEGLTDLDFGKWEGQSLEIVEKHNIAQEIYELWRKGLTLPKYLMENLFRKPRQRSLLALNKIIADCKQGTVVISHSPRDNQIAGMCLLGLE